MAEKVGRRRDTLFTSAKKEEPDTADTDLSELRKTFRFSRFDEEAASMNEAEYLKAHERVCCGIESHPTADWVLTRVIFPDFNHKSVSGIQRDSTSWNKMEMFQDLVEVDAKIMRAHNLKTKLVGTIQLLDALNSSSSKR
jgi:hypothetical protein